MTAKIDEILLIELVQKHECLYNMKSKHYRDQIMRGEAWEDIAQEMDTTGDAVKTTWTKLRNCFFNAQKRRSTKSGQAATKFVKWKYEKEMEFLLPYLKTRETQTDEQPEESNDVKDDDADHEMVESQEEHEFIVNYSPFGGSCNSGLKNQMPRRTQTSNPAQEMVKILTENAELRRSIPKIAEDRAPLDEIDMFYLSMAKTVKRLPPIDQATIRMKLCSMISEAEIRQMTTDS